MKTKIHPHICIQAKNTRLSFEANVDETNKGKQILVINRLASFTLVLSVCSLFSSLKTSAAAVSTRTNTTQCHLKRVRMNGKEERATATFAFQCAVHTNSKSR